MTYPRPVSRRGFPPALTADQVRQLLDRTPPLTEILASKPADEFGAFVKHRASELGVDLTAEFGLPAEDDVVGFLQEIMESAHLTEHFLLVLLQGLKRFDEEWKDPQSPMARLAAEALCHPVMDAMLPRISRDAALTPLRAPVSPGAQDIVDLVEAIAARAGKDEGAVHHRFNGLAAEWHKRLAHHNMLLAVFDAVETEVDDVKTAAILLEIGVVLETRLAPFLEALDDVLVIAGSLKATKPSEKSLGRTVKNRVHRVLCRDFPKWRDLVDPKWVDLRNAAMHGSIGRIALPWEGLVSHERNEVRLWDVERSQQELDRLRALVGPLGAVSQALHVLGARFSLRYIRDAGTVVNPQLLAVQDAARQRLESLQSGAAEHEPGGG